MAQSAVNDAPSQDTSNMGMVLSSYASLSVSSPYIWIVDSGAAIHICHSRVFFWNCIPLTNRFVTLPNVSRIPVLGIGSVTLNTKLTLHNVLHIPTFAVNLISIGKLMTQCNISVNFDVDDLSCILQAPHTLQEIGKGHLNQGLFLLEVDPIHYKLIKQFLVIKLFVIKQFL